MNLKVYMVEICDDYGTVVCRKEIKATSNSDARSKSSDCLDEYNAQNKTDYCNVNFQRVVSTPRVPEDF